MAATAAPIPATYGRTDARRTAASAKHALRDGAGHVAQLAQAADAVVAHAREVRLVEALGAATTPARMRERAVARTAPA